MWLTKRKYKPGVNFLKLRLNSPVFHVKQRNLQLQYITGNALADNVRILLNGN